MSTTRRAGEGSAPALAYFHGGGWVQGDLETHHGLCARLAQRAGIVVVAVDYRLAPEHKFPAAVEDCLAAYRWLREHGREIGADPARVGVGGDSAGGNLSAVVSQQARGGRPARPDAARCSSIRPPTSRSTRRRTRARGRAHHPARPHPLVRRSSTCGETPTRLDVRASPIRGDLRGQPPALVVTAGFDPLRDEGHAYAEALRKAGADVVYREYPGQIHAFVSLTRAIPQGMACTLEIGDYLRRRLGQG